MSLPSSCSAHRCGGLRRFEGGFVIVDSAMADARARAWADIRREAPAREARTAPNPGGIETGARTLSVGRDHDPAIVSASDRVTGRAPVHPTGPSEPPVLARLLRWSRPSHGVDAIERMRAGRSWARLRRRRGVALPCNYSRPGPR